MAALWNPPALLAVAAVLAAGAAAYWYGLGPALRRTRSQAGPSEDVAAAPAIPLPAAGVLPNERDELWGEDDPPPPAKRPYTYPPPRPVEIEAPTVEAPADGRAAPLMAVLEPPAAPETTSPAISIASPPAPVMSPSSMGPPVPTAPQTPPAYHPTGIPSSDAAVMSEPARQVERTQEGLPESAVVEEEPSLADFFRPRRPPTRHEPAATEKQHSRDEE